MHEHPPAGAPRRSPPSRPAIPLRESLRHLRDTLHRGRDLAGEALDHSPLPPPVAGLARGMLSEIDRVALRVESLATEAVRGLLGGAGPVAREADRQFGEELARAFTVVLSRIGGEAVEMDAFAAARIHAERTLDSGVTTFSAVRLFDDVVALAVEAPAGREDVRQAVFAALLWWLADERKDHSALLACADLAVALAAEIRAAAGRPDAMERLFAEFQDHV